MTDLLHDGHLTRFTWHRARRTATDRPFTVPRTAEAILTGASVEIDVRAGRNGIPDIRHDPRRWWSRRPSPPLTAVADAVADAARPLPSTALLQLDIKDRATVLTTPVAELIAAAVSPLAPCVIVSGTDPVAVARIADAARRRGTPVRTGHDPCTRRAVRELRRTGDIRGFVARAVAA